MEWRVVSWSLEIESNWKNRQREMAGLFRYRGYQIHVAELLHTLAKGEMIFK